MSMGVYSAQGLPKPLKQNSRRCHRVVMCSLEVWMEARGRNYKESRTLRTLRLKIILLTVAVPVTVTAERMNIGWLGV